MRSQFQEYFAIPLASGGRVLLVEGQIGEIQYLVQMCFRDLPDVEAHRRDANRARRAWPSLSPRPSPTGVRVNVDTDRLPGAIRLVALHERRIRAA
ncbi:hypothetical protein [Embleya sp. NBC_00888]|uniref:hypothetical protein n=1 Tax=Embleya sp. NBC_00888 TaxID=2975960 RepID=UPI002F918DD8